MTAKRDFWREAQELTRAERTKQAAKKARPGKKQKAKPDYTARDRQPGVIRVTGKKRVGDSQHVHRKRDQFRKRRVAKRSLKEEGVTERSLIPPGVVTLPASPYRSKSEAAKQSKRMT